MKRKKEYNNLCESASDDDDRFEDVGSGDIAAN